MSRRVVITGLGTINPLGASLAAFADALLAGVSGTGPVTAVDLSSLPVRIGAEVKGFDAREYLDKKDRKSLKLMVRTIQLAVAAARLALDHADLRPGAMAPERLGTSFGNGTIPGDLADLGRAAQACFDPATGQVAMDRWGREGLPLIPPMWLLNHIPNMPACHASILNDCRGPNNTITQTDAAGLLALGEAFRIVRRGRADAMLTGGSDTGMNGVSYARYLKFGTLSRRNDDPARACRPFDRDRDGTVLGEGASMLILEELEHARRRGIEPLAEVSGFASGMDMGCRGAGLVRVIREALQRAGIGPGDLDHVNAHAGGLPADAWEAQALREVVGDVGVVSFKGALGTLGAGSSTTELIASLLALRDGRLAPTLNCDNIDPACPVNVVRAARPVTRPYVLKVAATDRGQCAALVVRRPG